LISSLNASQEVLYLNAQQAVSEFSDGELKDRYNNALATFRMPYWDWAAIPPSGEGTLPSSVQKPTIDIILPNGTTTVPNPLFSYNFHPLNQNNDFVRSNRPHRLETKY
jgi:tyrosinase